MAGSGVTNVHVDVRMRCECEVVLQVLSEYSNEPRSITMEEKGSLVLNIDTEVALFAVSVKRWLWRNSTVPCTGGRVDI